MGVSALACVHTQWDTAMRKELPENGDGLRDECAKRFQQWIRRAVPSGARKRVAAQLGVSPETVDVWIDGQHPRLPGTRHFLAALAAWGPEFAGHVLRPCGDWAEHLSLAARVERLRQELEELKREVDALGSPLAMDDEVHVALARAEEAFAKARERTVGGR